MEYGRLGKPEAEPQGPGASTRGLIPADPIGPPRKSRPKLIFILAALLIVAAAVSAAVVVVVRNRTDSGGGDRLHTTLRPSLAMSRACSRTRYPSLCVNTLLDFPGSATASDKELVHISVNMTLNRFSHALYFASEINNLNMEPHVRSAYEDCLELLDDSVALLSRSLTSVAPGGTTAASNQDVMTWLSAALTNQDTCSEGFDQVNGYVKNQMSGRLKDLSELVSNCLAIYAAVGGNEDFAGVPIQNRRLLTADEKEHKHFPVWLSRRDRRLLDMPVTAINADIIVSKDGNGTVKTIVEAIKKAPEYGNRRFIIYVRAGK